MAREADYADVVGVVFAAELRAEADFVGFFEELGFELTVAESVAEFVAVVWKLVVIFH